MTSKSNKKSIVQIQLDDNSKMIISNRIKTQGSKHSVGWYVDNNQGNVGWYTESTDNNVGWFVENQDL